jgi:3-phosphoshikimate 1-carboxyvinyltransferase
VNELVPPISKSDAQRALVLADVLGVPFTQVLPAGETLPRDVEVLRDGLIALRAPLSHIDCHDGGAPFRFLVGQASVLPSREVHFTGTPRLGARPHLPLLQSLRAAVAGLDLTVGDPWPVTLKTPHAVVPTRLVVEGAQSSQFASSVLLAAARVAFRERVSVEVVLEGALASEGYFSLTRSWVERCGSFDVTVTGSGLIVTSNGAEPYLPPVPGDWSSIGYLLALSWVSGLPIARVQRHSGHPDELALTHFASVGLSLTDGLRVIGTPSGGLTVDASQCPDSIPLLAVLATKCAAPSRFSDVSILRLKESDRLAGIVELLASAGLSATTEGDALTVTPGVARAFTFDAHDDHRLAMSAAVLARLHGVALRLTGGDSVAKSFPDFWRQAAKAGVSAP